MFTREENESLTRVEGDAPMAPVKQHPVHEAGGTAG